MSNTYLKLQIKRGFKMYLTILFITLITIISIVLTSFVLYKQNTDSVDKKKITVGVVGNTKDSYFEMGIVALKKMDNSRFFVDFPEMTEDEAKDALQKHEINAYVYIPEDFIKGIYYGENIPAQYVTLNTPDGFGSALMNEVVELLSNLVVETQNGMYSMQDVAKAYNRTENLSEKVNTLNLTYLSFVLRRNEVYDLNLLGVSDFLSTEGYYICGILLFLLLIWGISCSQLLSARNLSLVRALNASGIGIKSQLLSEYISYLILTAITFLIFAILFGAVVTNNSFGIRELEASSISSCIMFIINITPVVIMITVMHKLFYELVSGIVSGILLQFIIAIGLGYISGCFYPDTFFPDTIRKVAEVLPAGTGFAFLRKTMSDTISISDYILPFVYTVIFAGLTVIVRKRRMAGDQK